MWQEFKAFVNKGNVLDLAVGVIIGAAFGKIITSFTDDLLMPLISLATGGGTDFSNKFILLGDPGDKVITTLAEAKAAGADAVFCKGGDRHAGNIPELTVLRRHGALLIDGLGAKIDSSSRIIAQAKDRPA